MAGCEFAVVEVKKNCFGWRYGKFLEKEKLLACGNK